MWHELGVAFGLVLVIEGIIYAVAPNWMRRMLHVILTQPTESVRTMGVIAALLGVALVWLVKSG